MRYVDDKFVIQQEEHKQIDKVDPAIKFTIESNQQDGAIPLPDTKVMLKADNSLSLTVYGKPTHTDQYLHHISAI